MIKEIRQIPITAESHPFGTAEKKCDFARRGFVEEEYFMYGTANVYKNVDGIAAVAYRDAPYVNRFVVRRPDTKERFSGNIVVEILNSTSWIDIDRMWAISREKFLRDGDIYVGITSKPNTIPAMKKLDPKRYAELAWPNPRKATKPTPELGNFAMASNPETEDGLFWDMLIDLAEILRDPDRMPIIGLDSPTIYLTGWSQSGAYMTRFINTFANKDAWKIPLFDGYLSAGAASIMYPGLNQEEAPSLGAADAAAPWRLGNHYQPYIDIHTESENTNWGTKEARHPDSDDANFLYRAYDIPGASHDTYNTMVEYYKMDPDLFVTGMFPAYGGKEPMANDFPYEFVFNAAYQMLFDWVRDGVSPPRIPLIDVDAAGENALDEHGNATGGWRTAFVDHPVCTYHKASTPLTPSFVFGCRMFGYKIPFNSEKLKSLYGSSSYYRELVTATAIEQILAKQLLPSDREAYIELAVKNAETAGLE